MHLLPILQAGQPPDEFGSPIILFLFLIVAAIVLVVAMVVAGASAGVLLAAVGFAAIAAVVALSILAAAFCIHLALATIVWTRRPRTYAWMSRRWWGVLTLFTGFLAAVIFWWLHYVHRATPRCHKCGYDLRGCALAAPPPGMCLICPECAEPCAA